MNSITLSGRLVKDPELKSLESGTKYARFKLAVSRVGAKEGQQKADFIPCIAWAKTAEILTQYAAKGSLVGITGRLTANEYEKDGERKISFEVIALNIELLGSKPEPKPETIAETAPKAPVKSVIAEVDEYIEDADLPFQI